MDEAVRDFRYAGRRLLREPGFAAAATLTLGLGIGVNLAIFSLVDGVLFKPLPAVQRPDRLVALYSDSRASPDVDFQGIPYPDFEEYRSLDGTLDGLATYLRFPFVLREPDAAVRVLGELVSGEYFSVLGVEPHLGRLLQSDDDHPAAPPVVVLGHRLWTERFGADPGLLGAAITLNREPLTVVGVAPPRFRGALLDWYGGSDLDAFVPFAMIDRFLDTPVLESRGFTSPMVIGKLREGVALAEARTVLEARASQLEGAYPETNRGRELIVLPAQRARFWPGRWDSTTRFLTILSVSGALLLVIVCFNLANLLLARVASQRFELAVQLAFGAPRRRLVRQWLVEALMLVVGGAITGGAFALILLGMLADYPTPLGVPLYQEVFLDRRTLVFTIGISSITCFAFGLAPALAASRASVSSAIKAGRQAGSADVLTRELLIVVQVAVSVVILIGAAVSGRSLIHLASLDVGFATEGLFTVSLDSQGAEPGDGDIESLLDQFVNEVRAIPGVEAAALGSTPLSIPSSTRVWVGTRFDPSAPGIQTPYRSVTAGYFRIFSISMLQGRDFTGGPEDDREVIVDQLLAERHWQGEDPLGRQLQLAGEESPRTVVGVVQNIPLRNVTEPREPHFYVPITPLSLRFGADLTVRASLSAALVDRVREAIESVSSPVAIVGIQTMEERSWERLSRQRLMAHAALVLGVVALALAAVGIFGLLSFVVSRSTREFAIRMALGAEARQVGFRVVLWAARLTATGVAAGVVAWISLGSVVRAELYGIAPMDPMAIGVVVAALAMTTLAAAHRPVRRVVRTDPMVALKAE